MSNVNALRRELRTLTKHRVQRVRGNLALASVSLTLMLLQATDDMKPTYSSILAYSPDVSQLNATLYQTLSVEYSLEALQ